MESVSDATTNKSDDVIESVKIENTTPIKNKRGRPKKTDAPISVTRKSTRDRVVLTPKDLPDEETPRSKRRSKKISNIEKTKTKKTNEKPKTSAKRTPSKNEAKKSEMKNVYDFVEDEEDENLDNDLEDDEEFKINDEEKKSTSSDSSVVEIEDDDVKELTNDEIDESDANTRETRRSTRRNKQLASTTNEEAFFESDANLVLKLDLNEVVAEWKYELDPESKLFFRPILPNLCESALEPFLNKSSKPPKCVIYDCPHCKKMFTYPLVFKNHLFSCTKNKNVPNYILYCCMYPECAFKGQRKQEMVNHYFKIHKEAKILTSLENQIEEIQNECKSSEAHTVCDFKMSNTKKSQLEVNQYYFIDKEQFQLTYDYYYKFIYTSNRSLKFIDEFVNEKTLKHFEFNINNDLTSDEMKTSRCKTDNEKVFNLFFKKELNLNFAHSKNEPKTKFQLELKPFEIYQSNDQINDPFVLINLVNQVTSLDWCPSRVEHSTHQFLAMSTLPLEQLSKIFLNSAANLNQQNFQLNKNYVKNLFDAPNFVFILKLANFASFNGQENKLFAILNPTIGNISSLKWRPDFGGASCKHTSNKIIGNLLATSSNGNAYIFNIPDLTVAQSFKSNSKTTQSSHGCLTRTEKLNVFEFSRQIVLKLRFAFGQCTSGDWSQLNGATEIALGYANGSVAVFRVDTDTLNEQRVLTKEEMTSDENLYIYPLQTFDAHRSFIKSIKWSKLDGCVLATGSLFSREIKVWDLSNTSKEFYQYETFSTDLSFSLHSNDLLATKEINLKGENHILALDLSFNIFNSEKDESRTHSSLFYTNGTFNSIDQSDFLNKFLTCDSEGNVILSRSNDTKYWIPKHQLMFYSFCQVAKFSMETEILTNNNKKAKTDNILERDYSLDLVDKSKRVLVVDFERQSKDKKSSKPKTAETPNLFNKLTIDLNDLTSIRWNQNYSFLNWYAVGSLSGFVCLHKLKELDFKYDENF